MNGLDVVCPWNPTGPSIHRVSVKWGQGHYFSMSKHQWAAGRIRHTDRKWIVFPQSLGHVIPALVEIRFNPTRKEYSILARVKKNLFRASSTNYNTVLASEDDGWHQDHRVQTVGNQTLPKRRRSTILLCRHCVAICDPLRSAMAVTRYVVVQHYCSG